MLLYLYMYPLDNYIDGTEFLNLTRDDLVGFIDATGIVKKVLRHLDDIRTEVNLVFV